MLIDAPSYLRAQRRQLFYSKIPQVLHHCLGFRVTEFNVGRHVCVCGTVIDHPHLQERAIKAQAAPSQHACAICGPS